MEYTALVSASTEYELAARRWRRRPEEEEEEEVALDTSHTPTEELSPMSQGRPITVFFSFFVHYSLYLFNEPFFIMVDCDLSW